jgi:hypothetical protein
VVEVVAILGASLEYGFSAVGATFAFELSVKSGHAVTFEARSTGRTGPVVATTADAVTLKAGASITLKAGATRTIGTFATQTVTLKARATRSTIALKARSIRKVASQAVALETRTTGRTGHSLSKAVAFAALAFFIFTTLVRLFVLAARFAVVGGGSLFGGCLFGCFLFSH